MSNDPNDRHEALVERAIHEAKPAVVAAVNNLNAALWKFTDVCGSDDWPAVQGALKALKDEYGNGMLDNKKTL